jgi:alpha-beta hydrolase superfamily lysophospholipase
MRRRSASSAARPAATSPSWSACGRRTRATTRFRSPLAPNLDATIAYIASRSPISDPYARYQQAEKMKRERMLKNSRTYFNPWETIFEANPQLILERRERVSLPPILIVQGALDDNVLPALQQKFAATYNAAGGRCRLEIFDGCEHEWVAKPGPQTDRAYEMVKGFIARELKAGRGAG